MGTHERYQFILLSFCTAFVRLRYRFCTSFTKQLWTFLFISNIREQFKAHMDYLDVEGLEEFPCQTIWPLCYCLAWFLKGFLYLFRVNWSISTLSLWWRQFGDLYFSRKLSISSRSSHLFAKRS